MTWPVGGRRQSAEQREEIIRAWLDQSPEAATRLAVSRGLSAMYAYKLLHSRGLIENTRHVPKMKHREVMMGRSHSANLANGTNVLKNDPMWVRARALGEVII